MFKVSRKDFGEVKISADKVDVGPTCAEFFRDGSPKPVAIIGLNWPGLVIEWMSDSDDPDAVRATPTSHDVRGHYDLLCELSHAVGLQPGDQFEKLPQCVKELVVRDRDSAKFISDITRGLGMIQSHSREAILHRIREIGEIASQPAKPMPMWILGGIEYELIIGGVLKDADDCAYVDLHRRGMDRLISYLEPKKQC